MPNPRHRTLSGPNRRLCLGLTLLALAVPATAQISLDHSRHTRYWHDGPPFDLFGIAQAGDGNGYRVAVGHFNDRFQEGRADVAFADLESNPWTVSGVVHVVYNEDISPNPTFTQFVYDIVPDGGSGVGDREVNDVFGNAMAVGDFNGDGWQDLALGVPGEEVGGHPQAGAVLVRYGSITGLQLGTAVRLTQAGTVVETPEDFDRFGSALAATDHNNDGFDDLLVGVPDEDLGSVVDAGLVHVLFGQQTGGFVIGATPYSQGPCCSTQIGDTRETGDRFGEALAAGDFNHDGAGDVAIGIPLEDLVAGDGSPINQAGMVQVVYGFNGSNPRQPQTFTDFNDGTPTLPATGDQYGKTLLAVDLTFDSASELVIGTPEDDVFATSLQDAAGSVTILRGLPGGGGGLTPMNAQLLTQSSLGGIVDPSETGDRFGTALAAGDFNADGVLDLAIGAPDEDYFLLQLPLTDAGNVTLLFSTPVSGVTPTSPKQLLFAPADTATTDAAFGFALGAGDWNGDGHDDLAIGAPGNPLGATPLAGGLYAMLQVNVFSDGFESGGTNRWSATAP